MYLPERNPMKHLLFTIVVLCASSCSLTNREWRSESTQPEFLHRSVKKITDVIVHDIFSPPTASRIYVYATLAAYEADRHDDSIFYSLADQLSGLQKTPEPERCR